MGSKKSTTNSTSTQQASAWSPAQPYIEQGVQGLGDWMTGAGATSYQGPRVADLSYATNAGIDKLMNSTAAQRSSDYYSDVLGGKWLDQGNPYMTQLQDAVKASVMPSLNSQFSGAGLTGSTLHQGIVGRELGRAMAEPLFNAYEAERSRMDNAAGQLPNIDQLISGNYLTAGNILDSHAQNLVNAQQQQFEEDRLAPVRGINEALPMINQIGSQYGTQTGTQKGTTKESTPIGQQILGGAMMAAGAMTGMPMLGGMIGNGMGQMMGATPSGGYPWSLGQINTSGQVGAGGLQPLSMPWGMRG